MPRSPLENVVSHKRKLIENFQTSPKDFYASVVNALDVQKGAPPRAQTEGSLRLSPLFRRELSLD